MVLGRATFDILLKHMLDNFLNLFSMKAEEKKEYCFPRFFALFLTSASAQSCTWSKFLHFVFLVVQGNVLLAPHSAGYHSGASL